MGKKVGGQKVENYNERSQQELASEAAARGLGLGPDVSQEEIVAALEDHDRQQEDAGEGETA